jgi:hypothetical protein
MFDDRKSEVYKLLPSFWIPKTVLVSQESTDVDKVLEELEYPIIIKPDIGFKGFLVAKVDNDRQLNEYKKLYESKDFLLQEYVDHKREFSLLMYRYPKTNVVGVSSFIEKTYPEVVGDGIKTLRELIDDDQNPFLKKEWIKEKFEHDLHAILEKGETKRIDIIGNYSRGAKFHSLNESIDDKLIDWATNLFKQVNGIDFCRLDLKADSIEEMKQGQFKLLELNGAKSEPLHIYDPKHTFFSIVKDIHKHWKILAQISNQRIKLSYKMPPLIDGLKSWWITKNIVK